jgi:hypothetical protein
VRGVDAFGQGGGGFAAGLVSPRLPGISITDSTASVSMISSTSSYTALAATATISRSSLWSSAFRLSTHLTPSISVSRGG